MRKIGLDDVLELKRKGYHFRAYFFSPNKVPYSKTFRSEREMNEFIDTAKKAGSTLRLWIEL